jgi:hypothetical protein
MQTTFNFKISPKQNISYLVIRFVLLNLIFFTLTSSIYCPLLWSQELLPHNNASSPLDYNTSTSFELNRRHHGPSQNIIKSNLALTESVFYQILKSETDKSINEIELEISKEEPGLI